MRMKMMECKREQDLLEKYHDDDNNNNDAIETFIHSFYMLIVDK